MRGVSHTGKSKNDKKIYSARTSKINAEPTVKEPDLVEFSGSDKRESLSDEGIAVPPRSNLVNKQENFFQSHPIISIVCGIFAAIFVWFIITVPQDIGNIKGKLEGMQDTIVDLKGKYDSMFEKINNIDKELYKNDYKIKQLKK